MKKATKITIISNLVLLLLAVLGGVWWNNRTPQNAYAMGDGTYFVPAGAPTPPELEKGYVKYLANPAGNSGQYHQLISTVVKVELGDEIYPAGTVYVSEENLNSQKEEVFQAFQLEMLNEVGLDYPGFREGIKYVYPFVYGSSTIFPSPETVSVDVFNPVSDEFLGSGTLLVTPETWVGEDCFTQQVSTRYQSDLLMVDSPVAQDFVSIFELRNPGQMGIVLPTHDSLNGLTVSELEDGVQMKICPAS